MIIVIEGNPIAKIRHRLTSRGGYATMYDPQHKEKEDIKKIMRIELNHAYLYGDQEIKEEASNLIQAEEIHITLSFYIDPPKSVPNSKRNAFLWGFIPCSNKKDIDNLIKFYLDCANEILFTDDHIITKITSTKEFSNNPRTVLNIMPKKKQEINEYQEILSVYDPMKLADLITNSSDLCFTFDLLEKAESDEDKAIYERELAISLKCIAYMHAALLKKVITVSDKHQKDLKIGKPLC